MTTEEKSTAKTIKKTTGTSKQTEYMKHILLSLLVLMSISYSAQQSSLNKTDSTSRMSFTCTFHANINYENGFEKFKDGYCHISDCSIVHINNFLISVPPEIAKKFDGKKVSVTGIYELKVGVRNLQKNSKNGEREAYQGTEEDSFLFISPQIELLEK